MWAPKISLCASMVSAGLLGCSSGSSATSDASNDATTVDAGVIDSNIIDAFNGPYGDFPNDPVNDTGNNAPPSNAATIFGAAGSGNSTGGPCLYEPEVGTLFPQNWLRPRFSWIPGAGETLFELRVTAANQAQPLIVYTTASSWTMPLDIWAGLSAHTIDQPITLTVRGVAWNGQTGGTPSVGSSGTIAIAPVAAPGSIVYWTPSSGTALRGFHIGDESVVDILTPTTADSDTQCVGCHSSTPDGKFVGYSDSVESYSGTPTRFRMRSSDGDATLPTFISPSAQTLMSRQEQWLQVFSPLHWTTGDRIGLDVMSLDGTVNTGTEIVWTDLEATSTAQGAGWGVVAREGDSGQAGYASFAHNTDDIVYVSATDMDTGTKTTQGDIMTVAYNARAGGQASPLTGAATSEYNEYYPTYSPDDKYVAFDRVATGTLNYNTPSAEVFLLPSSGGTPTRIVANDPPSCSGRSSPGVTNSGPKWAPQATAVDTRTFYWLTFSSDRINQGQPQLFVTPVIDDGGTLRTFPALYLWNQPADENNHTPAWDNFDIPIQ